MVCCIDFLPLTHSSIPEINSTWSWCLILLICYWIWFACILLRTFASTNYPNHPSRLLKLLWSLDLVALFSPCANDTVGYCFLWYLLLLTPFSLKYSFFLVSEVVCPPGFSLISRYSSISIGDCSCDHPLRISISRDPLEDMSDPIYIQTSVILYLPAPPKSVSLDKATPLIYF